MSLPALHAVRERFPKARITVLARPWVAGLYGREPFCDELIPYDAAKGWAGVRETRNIAADLCKRRFDCAILLPNSFESALVPALARVPVRIGYDRDFRRCLLSHPIPVPKPAETLRHQRFYYLELLRRSGVIASYDTNSHIRLDGARAAAEEGRKRFRAASLLGPVVGVSPGAAYGGAKRWVPERFAQAATTVARERKAAIAIFGSNQERDICECVQHAIEAAGRNCINFAGVTSIAEFVELVAACEVYLTNDSGPMHIASALGVPTVAVFGATDHEATGPTGDHSRVVREQVECSPCLLRECPIDHRCMTRVTAERVAETALDLIAIGKHSGLAEEKR